VLNRRTKYRDEVGNYIASVLREAHRPLSYIDIRSRLVDEFGANAPSSWMVGQWIMFRKDVRAIQVGDRRFLCLAEDLERFMGGALYGKRGSHRKTA